jgi:hypothetical protein
MLSSSGLEYAQLHLQCTIHYIGMDKLFNSINGSVANNIYILYLLLGTFHLFSFSFHFIIFHVHRIQAATCVCCVSGPSLHVHRHVRRTAPPVKKKRRRKAAGIMSAANMLIISLYLSQLAAAAPPCIC